MRYIINEETMTNIANAIRSKTGTTDAISTNNMADLIESIRTEAKPFLEGLTVTPNGKEIVEIPPFGCDGFGIVTVLGDENLLSENIKTGVSIYGVDGILDPDSGIDTTDATATANDILEGASAYVNGEKIIGTHICQADPILSEGFAMPTGQEFVMVPEEGVDGFEQVTVLGDDNLIPENILGGSTIYGVEGIVFFQDKEFTPTAEGINLLPDNGYTAMTEVRIAGDSNLVPENIVEGVSIFGVKGTSMSESTFVDKKLMKKNVVPGPDEIVLTPDEEYLGFSEVTVEGDKNLISENIINGVEIFGVKGSARVSDSDVTSGSDNRMYVLPDVRLIFASTKTG